MTPKTQGKLIRWPMALLSLAVSSALWAQAELDAGRILQENRQDEPEPTESGSLDINAPALEEAEPGGRTVDLVEVILEGNEQLPDEELQAVVQPFLDESQDLAGFREMANAVSRHYRDRGYLFARALLPEQTVDDGRVRLRIVEGRYGEVTTEGHPELAPAARKFLRGLREGDIIESRRLERSTLILSDQPGIKVSPVIQPGEATGSGDLDVEVTRGDRLRGSVGVDNRGNRFTGQQRLRGSLVSGSNFLLGDEISVSAMYTREDLLLGSVRYSLPLGGSGLRGFSGISYTDYQLGKEFAELGITGRAQVNEIGLSYPLLRSQRSNLTLRVANEYKQLDDDQEGRQGTRRSSNSVPVTLQFDHRDDLGAWGVTYGSVSARFGRMDLGPQLRQNDPGGIDGSYRLLTYDVVRLQGLPHGLSLMARLSGQHANGNLDSSEGLVMGGPNGVRAYPVGEGSGDRGWFGQFELRYRYGDHLTPFLFYDQGRMTLNVRDYDTQPNSRDIAGGGLGLRYDRGPWQSALSVAWRTRGGESRATGKDDQPLVWGTVSYRF